MRWWVKAEILEKKTNPQFLFLKFDQYDSLLKGDIFFFVWKGGGADCFTKIDISRIT